MTTIGITPPYKQNQGVGPQYNVGVPDSTSDQLKCDSCGFPMRPEHAHFRCDNCGARTSCCEGI